jgi:hypothetical protein
VTYRKLLKFKANLGLIEGLGEGEGEREREYLEDNCGSQRGRGDQMCLSPVLSCCIWDI